MSFAAFTRKIEGRSSPKPKWDFESIPQSSVFYVNKHYVDGFLNGEEGWEYISNRESWSDEFHPLPDWSRIKGYIYRFKDPELVKEFVEQAIAYWASRK